MKTKAKDATQRFIQTAARWPTIREIAETWDLPERFVRSCVERQKVSAIRLDFLRIDPASWEEFMRTAYRPGRF